VRWALRADRWLTSCRVSYILHTIENTFGHFVRSRRLALQTRKGNAFSLRQLAARIGVEPSYLSKLERGLEKRPSEQTAKALAEELEEDPDVLLALAGKVSTDLQEIIRKRPQLFSQLIRELKNMPDHAVLRLVREVRDGTW